MMRLTLVISTLRRGGAERAISILASSWAEQGKPVTLITLDDAPPAYVIHPSVKLERLAVASVSANSLQALARNFRRLRVLRQAIQRSNPDVVISFMDKTNVLTILATRGMKRPVVLTEHTDQRGYDIGPIWRALRRWTYRFGSRLVCLTESGLQEFRKISTVNSCVIPCPIVEPPQTSKEKANHDRTAKSVAAMGRLIPEKGFDLLLEAFSLTLRDHPQWSLLVIGGGPLRSRLELQAAALGLGEKVQFTGELADPFPNLRAADLFVLSSRTEAFPNALCEAMACGLPVISFDCHSGPSEIIRNEVDGILVPAKDVPALAHAMSRLMGDSHLRRQFSGRAPEVVERFSRERVLALWDDLFDQCGSWC